MMRVLGCRWTLVGALVCLLGVTGTETADAQSGSRAKSERREEAELFFRAGEQAFNAGQYLVAEQAFEQAYEILPLPAIIFSRAQASRLQYFVDKDVTHLLLAIELYRKYIQEVAQGGRRDDAATSLAELEVFRDRLQREGRLKSRRDSLGEIEDKTQLMVTTQVEGATASIDGKKGATPLILEVKPGNHRVEVQAHGHFATSQQATSVAGRLVVVEVALQPMPARLTVHAEPGASVHVDGRAMAMTPLSRPLEVPAGKHFVAVTRRGRYPWARELDLAHGNALDVRTRLETTSQRRISYWVLGASGLSLAATGGVGVLTYRADGDLAKLLERYEVGGISEAEAEAIRAAESRRDTRLQITYALIGASVVTALTGGLLYWFDTPQISTAGMSTGDVDPPREKTSSLRIAPLIDANKAGFAVAGHF